MVVSMRPYPAARADDVAAITAAYPAAHGACPRWVRWRGLGAGPLPLSL